MRTLNFDEARKLLSDELARLKATNVVISTNLPLRLDGFPRAEAARSRIEDPGAAVYFTLKGRQMVMACDRYNLLAANVRSIGMAIEAMRQLERHGGGVMMERAFEGFAALPPPGYVRPWRDVLNLGDGTITGEMISTAYRKMAKLKHPDNGGTATAMAELSAARDAAMQEIGL